MSGPDARAVSGFAGRIGQIGSSSRRLLVLGLDGSIAAVSLQAAMLLRFEGATRHDYSDELPLYMLLLVASRILAGYITRLHQWSFRFSGLADAARVGLGAFVGSGIFISGLYLMHAQTPPRSVVALELLLSALLMVLIRFSPRLAGMYVREWVRNRRDGALRTIIVGAGAAGEMLRRDLQGSREHDYQVVGFVDDDPGKHGQLIGGRSVLGKIEDLPTLVARYRLEQVLIAIPRLPAHRIRQILALCGDLKLRFRILPVSFIYLEGKAAASMIQDLQPEDLLPRESVRFGDEHELAGRRCLVTGAAGSIGSELCRQLLDAGVARLVMLDVDENGMYMLARRFEREFPGAKLVTEIASVRDDARISALFAREKPHDVFHAAAHKHVPLVEAAPCEAIKNNIVGTRNVARAADRCGAERFLYISTDKAVRPTSVMGATKRVGEEIVRDLARRSTTRFCAVRFGNVLGSAGSVVPIFREQIAAGGPVTVTDPAVRRYFMTISEAVALVLHAAYGDFGEMCVLDMGEQIRILDLARLMITMSGLVPDEDIQIQVSGLRPGEKLFEELMTEDEERTSRIERKIFLADCPPPRADLHVRIAELEVVANAERAERVVELLRELVPSYRNPTYDAPAKTVAPPVRSLNAV